ncbi:Der GTPase-activating protein YihI [Alteromonas halophila]|uniref:Der GTPase-activating protein YihI n=1 Tax=Alteromonas halophila TaxID=516698 RepID=A0A918JRI3_9ALTE|nr:Der GTPase-activating protein YihI [Alteromonas halophila]GGW96317.1 hypothetical protein GCM10007391_33050 [Alteromonas halophila]
MPRNKKSRKVGLIGVRKDPDRKPGENRSDRVKKPSKGKPAGNRHNVASSSKRGNGGGPQQTDPRHGSKKPVPLVKSTNKDGQTPQQKRRYATPAEELAALEADERLASLLDKLDAGESLNREQQAYVDKSVTRHGQLCEMLGIDLEEDTPADDQDDPLDSLDAINIDDYKR